MEGSLWAPGIASPKVTQLEPYFGLFDDVSMHACARCNDWFCFAKGDLYVGEEPQMHLRGIFYFGKEEFFNLTK